MICRLALEDGTLFTGTALGAPGTRAGEVVFNTALTGYQEVFTDPSYCGQIVTLTFPLQGNYGVNPDDFESDRLHLAGVVVKELPRRPSNYRATQSLSDFLATHGVLGLAHVDTRALTRRLRIHGALRGVLSTEIHDPLKLVQMARAAQPMAGANLVQAVAPAGPGTWDVPLWHPADTPAGQCGTSYQPVAPDRKCGTGYQPVAPAPRCHIVAFDCGIKHNLLRHFASCGCRVTTVPPTATADEIRSLHPDGLLVGNGPGDPATVTETAATLRALLGQVPIFGVCLGHQLLALALGAKTYKLKFGHHGVNLPVLNTHTGRVEITSQNHGFAVEPASLERAGGTVTHINLNDGTLEGFVHCDHALLAVQYHPEASPGPHDAAHMFRRFVETVVSRATLDASVLA